MVPLATLVPLAPHLGPLILAPHPTNLILHPSSPLISPHPSALRLSPLTLPLTRVPCAVQRSTLHAVGQKLRMLKARYRQPLPTARSEQSARQRSVHEGP